MTSAHKSIIQNALRAAAASALLVGAGLGLASCGNAGADTTAKEKGQTEAQSPYAAIAAGKVDVEGGLVDIAARQPGIVTQVMVEEGAEVQRGQILARLDDEQYRLQRGQSSASLQQAQAQLVAYQTALGAAQRNQARTEQLAAQNFVSPQAVENSRDAVRSAQSQVDVQAANIAAARASLAESNYSVEQSIVRAPADGRIVRRYANPGMGASTLNVTPMFQLQPHAAHIVRAELEERSLTQVHQGMRVEIVPEADQSKTYPGTVLRIAQVFGARKLASDDPSQQTDERVVEVVVDAQSAPVLVGQRVLVKFVKDGANPQAHPAAPAAAAPH
ncbi:MAG: efflux RND transporter periplasmic adaptor subunit [Terricaulis sp.]